MKPTFTFIFSMTVYQVLVLFLKNIFKCFILNFSYQLTIIKNFADLFTSN